LGEALGSLGWTPSYCRQKRLDGAETPGVFSCFFWLVNPPENLAGLDTPPKILRSQIFPPKGGLHYFWASIRYNLRGKHKALWSPIFFGCLKQLVTGKGWISYPVSMKGWMVQVVVSWYPSVRNELTYPLPNPLELLSPR